MFDVTVLNLEADWTEGMLINMECVFTKVKGAYTTSFINTDLRKINSETGTWSTTNYVNSLAIRAIKIMPHYICNDHIKAVSVINQYGDYIFESPIILTDSYWKTQSERYAKVKLYQLADIPQQDWIL